jgi:hypothetical protein
VASPHGRPGDAVDELFQVPLNEFTARRNALARTLSGADAASVRALTKPSVVAWAVNQVYWQARQIYDRLMKSGERLRNAQIAALEGRRADVRSASEAHRRAVAEAVAEAGRLASAAGSHPSPDALMRTFEAISLAPDPSDHPGRLSEAMQPAGFEALTGVTPKAVPAAPRPEPERRREAASPTARKTGALSPTEHRQVERERRRQEEADARRQAAEEKKRQDEMRTHQAAVEHAKAGEAHARAAWERSREVLREAEERLRRFQSGD